MYVRVFFFQLLETRAYGNMQFYSRCIEIRFEVVLFHVDFFMNRRIHPEMLRSSPSSKFDFWNRHKIKEPTRKESRKSYAKFPMFATLLSLESLLRRVNRRIPLFFIACAPYAVDVLGGGDGHVHNVK